jgi:hypothetical protein
MATCEENMNLTTRKEIKTCLNTCTNTFLTPKRNIVQEEVQRFDQLMNAELDDCFDKGLATLNHPKYLESK